MIAKRRIENSRREVEGLGYIVSSIRMRPKRTEIVGMAVRDVGKNVSDRPGASGNSLMVERALLLRGKVQRGERQHSMNLCLNYLEL